MSDSAHGIGPVEAEVSSRSGAFEDSESPNTQSYRLRVLLVEDNPMHRVLAVGLLKERGYAVSLAVDGEEAVEAFRSEPFDLVLMDIQMPRMDGLRATELIRAIEVDRLRRVPIIALTSLSSPDDRGRSLAAGMDEHLVKPIDPPLLDETIERCLRLDPPDFEPERALERAEGDADLLTQIVRLFLSETPARLEAIQRALASRDGVTVGQSAHTIEGVAHRLAMPRLRDIAHRIAVLSESGNFEEASLLMKELEAAFAGSTTAVRRALGSG